MRQQRPKNNRSATFGLIIVILIIASMVLSSVVSLSTLTK